MSQDEEIEAKDVKFIRVANPRIIRAIEKIRLVKQTVGSKQYDLTQEQVEIVTEKLHKEVDKITSAYDARSKTKEPIEEVL